MSLYHLKNDVTAVPPMKVYESMVIISALQGSKENARLCGQALFVVQVKLRGVEQRTNLNKSMSTKSNSDFSSKETEHLRSVLRMSREIS